MEEISAKNAVIDLCRALLQPIARLLLHCGVTWKEFAEIAKAAFVKVASEEFGLRGRLTNVSRVSILTGLGRREVRRQRAYEQAPARPTYLSPATRVLSGWHQDPDFLDTDGRPRDLSEDGADWGTTSAERSFEDLWRRYGGDVPVGALLKELLAVGAVVENGNGRLRVIARTYIPRKFDLQKLLRAGEVLEDFSNTVVHDLTCGPEELLRFERRAHALVDESVLPQFRSMLEAEGQALLERIDAWLTAHSIERSDSTRRRALRLGAGIYHIQDEDAPDGRR